MKIMVINDYAFVEGGAGKVAIESAIGLAETGNDVTFFSAVGPVCDSLKKSKIKNIICLGQQDILSNKNKISSALSGIKNKAAINNLKALFNDWRPDIVHVHGVSKALSWALINYCSREKIPVVYTLHDFGLLCPNMGLYDFKNHRQCEYYKSNTYIKCLFTNCDKRSYAQKLWRWVRFSYTKNVLKIRNKISGYVAVSVFVSDFFKNYLPKQSKLQIIYNPVVSSSENDVGQQFGFKFNNKNIPTFLFIGRLSTEKGIELLLDAIKEVNAKLLIIGEGELYNHCLAISKKLGENKVQVLKWQEEEDKIKFIRNSNAIILPSLVMETAGIALLEAKKHGIAAIVPDTGAFREFVKDNEDGIFFKTGSKDSLVRAMEKIIKDPKYAAIMGRNAKNNFKSYKSSIEYHVSDLIRFYINLIGTK